MLATARCCQTLEAVARLMVRCLPEGGASGYTAGGPLWVPAHSDAALCQCVWLLSACQASELSVGVADSTNTTASNCIYRYIFN